MKKTLSKQEIFDKVVSGLLNQGHRSMDSEHAWCMYRGAHGAKCAAGFLIEDEFYSPRMEDSEIPSLMNFENKRATKTSYKVGEALISSGIDPVHFDFVRSLQLIHDSIGAIHWKSELESLASDHDLKWPETT